MNNNQINTICNSKINDQDTKKFDSISPKSKSSLLNPFKKIPLDVKKYIFSFLTTSVKDLGNLSLVCKSFAKMANSYLIWKEICYQVDPEACKTKRKDQKWKNFCKELMMEPYKPISSLFLDCVTENKTVRIVIDINPDKAQVIHLKRLIHRECPTLPVEGMQILLNGNFDKEIKDDKSFVRDRWEKMLLASYLEARTKKNLSLTSKDGETCKQ